MNVFFKPVLTTAAVVTLSLCFSVTSRSQSMPGYQAPVKPKPADNVSVAEKAKRGEVPLAKIYGHLKADAAKTKRLPVLSDREKRQKRAQNPREKIFQIGIVRTLASPLDPLRDSTSYTVAEGEVHVASIVTEGALFTRIQFRDFSLPAGARVFVYPAGNPDQFFGPYEGKGPWNDGLFWTPAMAGDQIIIEYTTPAGIGSRETPFKILEVAHIYKNVTSNDPAGACNLDVPAEWATVAKSVGMLQFVTGGFIGTCTGTLLSDSNPNNDNYVLTANHCISNQSEAQSVTVYWNYNTGDTPPGGTPTTNGSNLMVTGTASDFTLLRLTGALPAGLFFSGWDATSVNAGTSVTGIHHPNGSHKRISFGATNANCPNGLPGPCQNFTGVTWSQGTTEPGSSGSGLWKGSSANPVLVGTLTGGGASCDTPTQSDYYGRFSVTYPSVASFLEGTNCVTSLSPANQNFGNGGGGSSFNVNAPGGCSWTAGTSDSWITVTPPANGSGNGTVSFTVQANSGPQRSGSIVVGGQVFSISQDGGGPCAATPISLGQTINGTLSTSDCPLDDGSFYDVYSFSATAGTQVSISMQSSAFDTFLFLNNPDGSNLTTDDDGGGGTNSRIPPGSGFITLPTTGTYTIWANSFDAGATGAYSVTLSTPPSRTLSVSAQNGGTVNIPATPPDKNGATGGNAPYTLTYSQGTGVNLFAPGTAPNGNVFQKWVLDGTDTNQPQTAFVIMNADHSMTAVYAPPITHTLTVAALNAPTGVSITVSPNDNNGLGNGTTQFTRTYNHNAQVTLTAIGITPEGNLFRRWLINGQPFNGLQNAIVTLLSDTTMTAEYYIKPKIIGEDSNPSAAVAINSVTFLRGPFQILDPHNFATDGHTRIIIFTNDLGLINPPLNNAAVLRVEASGNQWPIEAYGSLTGTPGLTGSYIVVRLPDGLPTNTSLQLVVWLFGINSDPKTVSIAP
jgi:pre-peptidase/trypsin-like peptidase/all-beta uncharacterized protein